MANTTTVRIRRYLGIRPDGTVNAESKFIDPDLIQAIGPEHYLPKAGVYVAQARVRTGKSVKEESVISRSTCYPKGNLRYYNLLEEIESTGRKLVPLDNYHFKQSEVVCVAPAGRVIGKNQTRITFRGANKGLLRSRNRAVYPLDPQRVEEALLSVRASSDLIPG